MSNSTWPHRRQPTKLPCPWDSPGKNTGVGCHFLLQCMKVKSEREVAQSCLTLSDPMDCSSPGSSIHGIFQARVLEWGAIAFSEIEWVLPKCLLKGESSWAIKWLTWILKKGRFPSKYIVSLTELKRTLAWVKHTGLLSETYWFVKSVLSLRQTDLKKDRV